MKINLNFSLCPRIFGFCLITASSLLGTLQVAQAQFTVQNPYLRVLFDDGFGNLSYNISPADTDPSYGDPLPAGAVTSVNGQSVPVGTGLPSDTYYHFTHDTSVGGTANGASVSMQFIAMSYGNGSNNILWQPYGNTGMGVSAGALQQFLINGSKLAPARLRMDWTITYVNNNALSNPQHYTFYRPGICFCAFSGNLPASGDYAQFRYHDVLTPSTGTPITIDNPPIGDTTSAPDVAGFFCKLNPITSGSFADSLNCNNTLNDYSLQLPISWNSSYTESGYLDVLVDPGSVQFNLAPVPQLAITNSGSNIIVSWRSSATGFNLQTNGDLSTSNWGNYSGTVNDDGTFKKTTTSLPTENLFFRLSTQ